MNIFGLLRLNNDDTLSIDDFANKVTQLNKLVISDWSNHDFETRLNVIQGATDLVKATSHYFKQQGQLFWRNPSNIDHLFKFLTLYSDAVYLLAIAHANSGFLQVAVEEMTDCYCLYPTDHRGYRQRSEQVANILRQMASDSKDSPKIPYHANQFSIYDTVDYLSKCIDKYIEK